MISTKTSKMGIIQRIRRELTTNSFPEISLNRGSSAQATVTARMAPASVTITDSVRNWAMRYLRGEPSTFLTPTSLARLAERAVDRFMKLIQARSRMKGAMAEKI